MKKMIAIAILMMGVVASATSLPNEFYVYKEFRDPLNHFIASGYMGDFSSIKVDLSSPEDPHSGKTSIKITYDGTDKQGAEWAGLYWQHIANNWGESVGGYDLTGYKRLTFWARGDQGGENIVTAKVGGIAGSKGDSDQAEIGPLVLTKDWRKYEIDLTGKNLSHIIGGFCLAWAKEDNQRGFVIFIDDVRFEK